MVNPMNHSRAEYAFDRVTAELQAMERCISDSAIPLVNWRRKRRRNLPAHNEVETFQALISFIQLRLTQIDEALEGILLEEDLSILKQKDRVDSFASAQGEVPVELVVHGDSVNDDFDPLKDAAGIHCSSSLVGGGHDDSTPSCSGCTCHATKEEPTTEGPAAKGGCGGLDGKEVF